MVLSGYRWTPNIGRSHVPLPPVVFFTCRHDIHSGRLSPIRSVSGHLYSMRIPLHFTICEYHIWACIHISICWHKVIENTVEPSDLKGIKWSSWSMPKSCPESYGLSDTSIPKFLIWLGLISEWSKIALK